MTTEQVFIMAEFVLKKLHLRKDAGGEYSALNLTRRLLGFGDEAENNDAASAY